ncbi:MAG TPA: hypothetical protein VMW50_14925 [Dehalococcoidia bacterium]|nr:hypothetical protein [Dehalococcoidia bacterium]
MTEKVMVRVSQAITLYIFILASISVYKLEIALPIAIICGVIMAYLEFKRKEVIR